MTRLDQRKMDLIRRAVSLSGTDLDRLIKYAEWVCDPVFMEAYNALEDKSPQGVRRFIDEWEAAQK